MQENYKKTFTITNNQLDKNDHLTLGAILDLIQEVSGNHADTLNCGFDDLIKRKLIWVVVRHHIEFKRNLHVGKFVEMETYPLKRRFVEYPREVKMYDNGQLFLVCNTTWVVVDLDNFNFKSDTLYNEDVARDSYFEKRFSKLPRKSKDELEFVKTAKVEYSMLDHNGHMNNSRYLSWYLDVFREERDPKNFQIEYLKQCFLDESIDLFVYNEKDSKELYGFNGDELKFYCRAEY